MGQEAPKKPTSADKDVETEEAVKCLRTPDGQEEQCSLIGANRIAEKNGLVQDEVYRSGEKGEEVARGHPGLQERKNESEFDFELSDVLKPFERILSETSDAYKEFFDGSVLDGQEDVAAALTLGTGGAILITIAFTLISRMFRRRQGGYIRVRGVIPQIGL